MVDKSDDLGGEFAARERYYWSKIRQYLKAGRVVMAWDQISEASREDGPVNGDVLRARLVDRVARTFTAGCHALCDGEVPGGGC